FPPTSKSILSAVSCPSYSLYKRLRWGWRRWSSLWIRRQRRDGRGAGGPAAENLDSPPLAGCCRPGRGGGAAPGGKIPRLLERRHSEIGGLPQQRIRPSHLLVHPSGQTAMSGLRSPGLLGLVLLMLSAGYCKEKTDSADLKDRQSLLNLIMEIIQELKRYHLEKDSAVQYFSKHDYNLDRREVTDYGGYQDEQRVEIVPRDLRMKDKFLKHLTGPLYFSPKCSKHFHRLYHNTRDCTIPASTSLPVMLTMNLRNPCLWCITKV
ncbi:Fam150b, partial [Columba guinea]